LPALTCLPRASALDSSVTAIAIPSDPAWLDKAIRTVDRLVREANGKQKGKGSEEALAA
jgi:hypothetical protein